MPKLALVAVITIFGLALTTLQVEAKPKKIKPGNDKTKDFHRVATDDRRSVDDKIAALDEVGELDAAGVLGLADTFLEVETLDRHGRLGNAIIETIEFTSDSEALEALRERVNEGELHVRLRIAYFNAIANNSSADDTEEWISEQLESSVSSVRVLAVTACGNNFYTSAFEKVVKLLQKEGSWRVQVATIEALANYAIDPEYTLPAAAAIIAFMSKIDGRLVEDCAKALRMISGEDFGTDAIAWGDWYKRELEDAENPAGGGTKNRYRTSTFDVDTYSKQLIFVVDCSSSMNEPVSPEVIEERKKVVTGKKKDDDEEDDIDWDKIKTKMDLAKLELSRSVRGLSEDTMFTLISYSTTVTPWKTTLVQATDKNKKDALKFIEGLNTDKLTNIYGALHYAIELAEKGYADEEEKKKRKGPTTGRKEVTVCDTIYFMTDGFATTGKYRGPDITGAATAAQAEEYADEMDAMVDEIVHRNQVAKITIHTIGVGLQHDSRTLKNLAEATDGSYVAIGAKK